jgi:Na+/H+ antiporter
MRGCSVTIALTLVVVVAAVIIGARLCALVGVPPPLGLLALGAVASFVPGLPTVELSPEVVLLGLLPPLLYAAALGTSLVDIRALLVPIIGLALGLVLFTALGVALVTWWLLPVSFPLALALGAIVSPPDAVAATAVGRRIGLPRRIITILEGESLLNDATALVTLRTALAAAGLGVVAFGDEGHGESADAAGQAAAVSFGSVASSFLIAAVGGILIGWVAFVVIGLVRRRMHTPAADTALSFIAPFVAYLPAEKVHASGVLAVVTAGLLLGHKAPVLQSAPSRLSERTNWAAITFVLENSVFLLIGLQISGILDALRDDPLSTSRTIVAGLAVLVVTLVLRPMWLFPFAWVADRFRRERGADTSNSAVAVASWAGMRGVVTLAAALTLPAATPHRPSLIMIALLVTVGTLLLQGTTLPVLARRLDVRGPDPRDDALQEATIVQAATAAGLRAIDELEEQGDPRAVAEIKDQAHARVNLIWERLGPLGGSARETPSEAYRRLRLAMIEAERAELLRIRDTANVDHEVLSSVMVQIDAEEAALSYNVRKSQDLRNEDLHAPERLVGDCEHLTQEAEMAIPLTPDGCAECLAAGQSWVHLRLCLHCGHVGCCDSSPGKHATAHFHETAHPVMRSLEPGEAWRWCFVDEVLG